MNGADGSSAAQGVGAAGVGAPGEAGTPANGTGGQDLSAQWAAAAAMQVKASSNRQFSLSSLVSPLSSIVSGSSLLSLHSFLISLLYPLSSLPLHSPLSPLSCLFFLSTALSQLSSPNMSSYAVILQATRAGAGAERAAAEPTAGGGDGAVLRPDGAAPAAVRAQRTDVGGAGARNTPLWISPAARSPFARSSRPSTSPARADVSPLPSTAHSPPSHAHRPWRRPTPAPPTGSPRTRPTCTSSSPASTSTPPTARGCPAPWAVATPPAARAATGR